MELAVRRAEVGAIAPVSRAPLLLILVTLAAIGAAFSVSSLTLIHFGINYAEAGGSLITKIHPATYLLGIALALRLLLQKHPIRFLTAFAADHRGAALFLWIVGSLLVYVALNLHVPLSSLIDTFIFPLMMLLLLEGIDDRSARPIALLVHAVFAANAALALYEMTSGWRLTPVIAEGVDLSAADHRSSALFGYPLGNAMLTGLYVIAFAVGGGRDLPHWTRPLALVLQLAAMATFGGRVATVAMVGLLIILALRGALALLTGARFRASTAALFFGLLPIAIAGLIGAYAAGFFDILLDRFVSDNRSAEARVIMFELMSRFTPFQLLFGPDQDLLNSYMWTEGIEFGIESFWVSFMLTYGILPSLLFFTGFGAFLYDLRQHAGRGSLWTIVYFLVVASGSLSIGAKTLVLGALVTIDLILLRAPQRAQPILAWPGTA